METSFGAATIANPQSKLHHYSNPIRLRTPNPDRLSNAVSFGCSRRGPGRGWPAKLILTSENRLIIEAVRKEKTGWNSDGATSNEAKWTHYGLITESLSNGMFRVRLLNLVDRDDPVVSQDSIRGYLFDKVLILNNIDPIIGYGSGKIRTNHILIVPGDIVKIEVGRYDAAKGRIIFRLDPKQLKNKDKEEEDEDEKFKDSKGKKSKKSKK